MSKPVLREVFPEWQIGKGIFYYLAELGPLPWSEDESVDQAVLDVAYFGNHSGGKFCSPLVNHLLNDDGVLPAAACETIAKILLAKYKPNWFHLWDTNIVAYNPIHNYDMTENRSLLRADSSTEDETRTQSDTTGTENSSSETDYTYGLNTDPENPRASDGITTEDSGTTELDSDINTKRNHVGADEETETLTRSGNIGVTTTQQMLTSERDLWKWNFFDQIFSDLDRELALMFHDPCRVVI